MYRSMISSAVSMGQLQQGLDNTSNNLSNSSLTGYKRRETNFADLLFQQVNNQDQVPGQTARDTPEGIRVGSGSRVAQTPLRLEQGTITETERSLDFAPTEKDLFFQVESNLNGEEETLYTRSGEFYLSENPDVGDGWTIVNESGEYLLNEDGERFDVPDNASDFVLQDDGTLQAELNNGETEDLGVIEMARVTRPQLLEGAGDSSFRLPDPADLDLAEEDMLEFAAGTDDALIQGSVEQSNVDMAQEMTEMLNMQRNYSFNARSISQGDQMMGLINNLRS